MRKEFKLGFDGGDSGS